MRFTNRYLLSVITLNLIFISCGEKNKHDVQKEMPAPVILRKDTTTNRKITGTQNAPIINITDSIAPKANIIYIKDSANSSLRLSQKLSQIYGMRLGAVMKQNKLKLTGAPVAWYKTQKPPYFFEAGLQVDKKPAKLPKNILYKTIGGDSALIAHFYGPYAQTNVAYEALNDWLKDRNKKLNSPAYEIYVSDPVDKKGNPIDPYKIQTDIIFPHD